MSGYREVIELSATCLSVCKVLKQSDTIVELISDSACHLLYIYKEIFPNLK